MQPVNNEKPVHADLRALTAELAQTYPVAQKVQMGEAVHMQLVPATVRLLICLSPPRPFSLVSIL